jgi:hypothetical protein
MDLGSCPTHKHVTDFRQCGFAGCVDLRVWAKAHRYRWRFEESYQAENDAHVRGDGRWFVEIPCKHGVIYPKGGQVLLAYASRGVKRHLAELGLECHQTDGDAEVFRFSVDRLDEVAAILKPRKRRTLNPNRARAIGKATAYGAQNTQAAQQSDEGAV